MDGLVLTLLAWIAVNTALTAPEPPRIVLIPSEQLVQMSEGTARPHGVYNFVERTIYLREDWTPDTLLNRAVLLHELVHHVLKTNNVLAQCERAYEERAYHLEIQWLREQGSNTHTSFWV